MREKLKILFKPKKDIGFLPGGGNWCPMGCLQS